MKDLIFLNSKELRKYLENWIKVDNNLLSKPVIPFIHGKAGIGKTQIIEELSKSHNKELVILNLSHQEEGDLIGIPKQVEENGKYKTIWAKPEWLANNEEKEVILFLDEIDRAPKNILNAILTLLREYRIHTHHIPKNWKIIAAGNSGINDEFYDIQEMDNALSSRFVHLFYEPNYKEWLAWAKNNGINEVIIKYIETKPEHLLKENAENFNFSYPNPRTWEYLSENMKFIQDAEILKFVAIGLLGNEVGIDFYIFYKTYKNISYMTFEEIIKNFQEFKNKNKNFYINTVLNISNNIDIIFKNFNEKILVETFLKIILYLGNKQYYEIAYLLINLIETKNPQVALKILDKTKQNEKYEEIFNKIKNFINS